MITKEEASKRAMNFLKKHTIGVLATANSDGQPSVSPVYYVVLSDFSIYFSTSHHTQKFKNLLLNNAVAFSVGTGPEYTVVNISGHAKMTDENEREEGLRLITTAVGSPMATWPIKAVKSLEEGGVALFKITPATVTYLDLTSKDVLDDVTNYFYEILP